MSTKPYDGVPHVIEVIPHEDYSVDVTFREGKTVTVNMRPLIEDGKARHTIYTPLSNINDFMGRCTIINNTLAWDTGGKKDAWNCVDMDPVVLWNLPESAYLLMPGKKRNAFKKLAAFLRLKFDTFLKKTDMLRVKLMQRTTMPEISIFFGMRITMNPNDHNPPHFHVEYAGKDASIDINEGVLTNGTLPAKQTKLAIAWCEIHRAELLHNWELLRSGHTTVRINPLA